VLYLCYTVSVVVYALSAIERCFKTQPCELVAIAHEAQTAAATKQCYYLIHRATPVAAGAL
jgi:hypothetical protein